MDRSLLSSQNATKICRICFDDDNLKDFISPCLCSGGSEYVHRKCLDNWRSVNKDGRAFSFCDVCQFKYVIEPVVDDPSSDRKRLWIFRLFVTRDITLIILLIQAIIIGMTFLIQAADKTSQALRDLYPSSMNSFGIYYLSSLIILLAILGFFGFIALCCGCLENDADDDGRCNCACYSCVCFSSDCNNCGSHSNCNGGGDGQGIIVALIAIVVIFAIIGVFFGVILSGILIRKIINRHTKKLWLRQEVKKYIVKDFQGRRNELTYSGTGHPMTTSSINTEINNNRTDNAPSAPVQLLSFKKCDNE